MATNTTQTNPSAVRMAVPVVCALRKTITYSNPGTAVAMVVGVVPAGAVITGVWAIVKTAFNDSGNDLMDIYIGTNSSTTQFMSAVSVATVGLLVAADDITTQTVSYSASDQTISAMYTGQNSNATAGEADIIVQFVPNVTG